ncbi:MAG TPA: hypothetical protein VIX89_00345 [Bryobacteraceae bacterium]
MSRRNHGGRKSSIFAGSLGPAVVKTAILVLAFTLTWYSGHRGLFLFDQSAGFDGAWRILQGQVPYRDFYMAFPPIMLWIQAAFFKVAGLNFSSMVLSAAVVNVLATASIMRITGNLVTGASNFPVLLAGLVTAIWFQPPFGTLWMEQVAFLFACGALQCTLEAGRLTNRFSMLFWFLAGCCMTCAFLSKQNAGAFFAPVCAGVIMIQNWRTGPRLPLSLASFGAGALIAAAVFLVWLRLFSDPALFWRHAIEVAGGIGKERVLMHLESLAEGVFLCLLTPRSAIPPSLLGMLIGPLVLIVGALNLDLKAGRMRRFAICGFLLLSLPLYQNLFIVSTMNEPQNGQPFLGLIVGLLLCVVLLLRQTSYSADIGSGTIRIPVRLPTPAAFATAAFMVLLVLSAWVVGEGVLVARYRIVQEFGSTTRFVDRIQLPGLERVYWGDPTLIPTSNGLVTIRREDFENVARYLQSRPGNFFVAGDATILYGLLRKPSPSPLLFFAPNHSQTASDIPRLDNAILHSLETHNIQTVVKEQFTFMSTQPVYSVFPQTWSFLTTRFEPVRQFGIFEIWERKQ